MEQTKKIKNTRKPTFTTQQAGAKEAPAKAKEAPAKAKEAP